MREALRLSQYGFADLLKVSQPTITRLEQGSLRNEECWDRVLQFLIDCRDSAVEFLQKTPLIDASEPWVAQVRRVAAKLGWSFSRLAEFLNIHVATVSDWLEGEPAHRCHQILAALLESYAEVDPRNWPAALHEEEPDVITEERIRLLRLSLGMKQAEFGSLLHIKRESITGLERGRNAPSWCVNLLLRVLETYPRATELLERIPWDEESISADRAFTIRKAMGLTALELARLLGSAPVTIFRYEQIGVSGMKQDCAVMVYRLLEQYPEEFVSYLQGLSSPGGQACPIW